MLRIFILCNRVRVQLHLSTVTIFVVDSMICTVLNKDEKPLLVNNCVLLSRQKKSVVR